MASILQRTQIRYTFAPGIENAIEFLVSLYNSRLGYSAISTARSPRYLFYKTEESLENIRWYVGI